ncbi:MAG: disulfide bond formation protein B [Pseudomonadota bacterium]
MLIALLGPTAVLGAALFSQYVGGLSPCPMCIWQRWPHAIAIALAALALALGARRAAAPPLGLAAAALLVGAGIGVFHAGVELKLWDGPSTCVGGPVGGVAASDLLDQIMSAPVVRCDEVVWSFLGISMAGWNAILSLGLAVVAATAASRLYASSSASQ